MTRARSASSTSPSERSGRDGCGGLVEVEVALADEHPGGLELEPVGEVVVGVEDLADVRVRVQAGRVAAEPAAGSADLSEGDGVGAGLGDRVAAVAEGGEAGAQPAVGVVLAGDPFGGLDDPDRMRGGTDPWACWADRTREGSPKSSVALVRYFAR